MPDQKRRISVIFQVGDLSNHQTRPLLGKLTSALSTSSRTTGVIHTNALVIQRDDASVWDIKKISDEVFEALEIKPRDPVIRPAGESLWDKVQEHAPKIPITLESPIQFINHGK